MNHVVHFSNSDKFLGYLLFDMFNEKTLYVCQHCKAFLKDPGDSVDSVATLWSGYGREAAALGVARARPTCASRLTSEFDL